MSENGNGHMKAWNAMARPPATALKTIRGGRLQGMTDVNPQWRYQAMTEQYGPCGSGWKYAIDRLWTEAGCDGEVLAFAQVSVRTRETDEHAWSEPVIGVGGNHMIVKESKGLRNNDECWKMAITDALSVALKMLGVAADIYAGLWDGTKYAAPPPPLTIEAPQRVTIPDGAVQILKVEPKSKRNFMWADVTFVDHRGEQKTLPLPGDPKGAGVTLCEQLAQDCTPAVLTTATKNNKTSIDKIARYKTPEQIENERLDAEIAAKEAAKSAGVM